VLSCSTTPESSGFGTLTLGLEACPDIQAGTLEPYGVCGFNVSVYSGQWHTGPPSKVFDSGCMPYSGDQVTIDNIPAGSDRTVYYEMHPSPDCSGSPRLVGARGGIDILKGAPSAGIWHVSTFELGGFRGLPIFDPELRVRAAATPCATDDVCLGVDEDEHYILSPVASCDIVAGHCQVPESLYPLNQHSTRAFHSAVGLDDGRIVLMGGLTRLIEGQIFNASDDRDPVVEIFDPISLTWSTVDIEQMRGPDGKVRNATAFHRAVYLGGTKIALIGGVRRAEVSIGDGTGNAGSLSVNIPPQTGPQNENASDLIFVIDVDDESAVVGSLGSARFMANAQLITTVTGPGLLVTGGAVPMDSGRVPVNTTELCSLGDEGLTCAPPNVAGAPLARERMGHCSLCLDETPGKTCDSVFVYGGATVDSPGDAVAEVYDGVQFTPLAWGEQSAWDGQPLYPTCIRSGQRLYFLGGTSDGKQGPDVPALTLSVSAVNSGGLVASRVLGTDDEVSTLRVHHAATLLTDGRVLITGGLGVNGGPVASAHILTEDELTDMAPMAQPRWGHTATAITTGPLRGGVLITGGFTSAADGEITFAGGAEIYLPETL